MDPRKHAMVRSLSRVAWNSRSTSTIDETCATTSVTRPTPNRPVAISHRPPIFIGSNTTNGTRKSARVG